MFWVCVQGIAVGDFDDSSKIEDHDSMADMSNDREVVADEDHRESEFALQVLEEIDDLRLN